MMFEKPVPAPDLAGGQFRIMRPAQITAGRPVACEAHHRIKEAGYRRKQEGAPRPVPEVLATN